MFLEAGVIRKQTAKYKIYGKPGSVLSEPGRQWNDVLQTLPLYSPDHKFSETGPVP